MTQETIDSYCENVIAFFVNALKKHHTIDMSNVMEIFDINIEQCKNCYANAENRLKNEAYKR